MATLTNNDFKGDRTFVLTDNAGIEVIDVIGPTVLFNETKCVFDTDHLKYDSCTFSDTYVVTSFGVTDRVDVFNCFFDDFHMMSPVDVFNMVNSKGDFNITLTDRLNITDCSTEILSVSLGSVNDVVIKNCKIKDLHINTMHLIPYNLHFENCEIDCFYTSCAVWGNFKIINSKIKNTTVGFPINKKHRSIKKLTIDKQILVNLTNFKMSELNFLLKNGVRKQKYVLDQMDVL